jgi:acetyl esterase/lipase
MGSPAVLVGVAVTLVHGDRDRLVPVEFSRGFARRAAATGDRISLRELPDTGHFELIDPHLPAWPTVVEAGSAALAAAPGFDDGRDSR